MKYRALAVLVVIAAVALVWRFTRSESPRLEASSDVELCRERLREIYAGLKQYAADKGGPPQGSGAKFLAALVADGVWPATADNAYKLTCPGVAIAELDHGGRPPEAWFADLARVTGASTAYAGRDMARFPLAKFPCGGHEPVAACDNHAGQNHERYTNVLFADGSIETWDLEQEIAEGRLPAGAAKLAIGAGASDELLAKLSAD
jgi:prepilin-type processing-associated H-X9-DG protein